MIKLTTVLLLFATVLTAWGQSEDDDYWSPPDPETECGPGEGLQYSAMLLTTKCDDCPIGQYNFEGSRVDECMSCPIGQFSSTPGSTFCYSCEQVLDRPSTTRRSGSTSVDECVDPDEIISNFAQATVTIDITVAGKDFCTGIEDLLMGMSNVIPWDGHFSQCSVTEDTAENPVTTEMTLEVTLPAKFAWYFYSAVNFVDVHTQVVSAYAELGSFYAERMMRYVNYLVDMGELTWLGLDMDPKMLKLDGIELRGFEASFKGHCKYAPRDDDYLCSGEPDEDKDAFPNNYYAVFSVTEGKLDCSSNAGRIKLRNRIEEKDQSSGIIPCQSRNEETCELRFVECKEGNVYIQVTQLRKGEEINIDMEMGVNDAEGKASWTFQDGESTVKFEASDMREGCNIQKKGMNNIDDLTNAFKGLDCISCGAGSFINDLGVCQKCPFGSWGDDGVHCNSCGWQFATPFWGMPDEGKCIQTNNWEEVRDSIYQDWESKLPRSAGNNFFELALTPTMNMCGPVHAKKDLDGKCLTKFTEEELIWPEDMNFNLEEWTIEQIICSGSKQVSSVFGQLCRPDWDKTWEEVFSALFEPDETDGIQQLVMDGVCFVLKRVNDLEVADTSDDCAYLEKDLYEMNMPVDLPSLGIDMGVSEILVPLFSEMENLVTMNFGSFADAGMAMMESMGMDDMNALVGWDTANNLRDIGMSVPRAFRMSRFTFAAEYDEEQFFCKDGQAKRSCDSYCDDDSCRRSKEDMEIDLQCERDECNNCAERFFYYEGGREVEFERCASCVDDFDEEIDNAVLKMVFRNNVEAQYVCNDGWVPEDCNSRAKCDYSSGENNIEYPNCIRDQCDWPESVDMGEFYTDWRNDDEMSPEMCPYKIFQCYEGYYSENGDRVECDVRDNFQVGKIKYPECKWFDFDDESNFDEDKYDGDDDNQGEVDGDGCYFPDLIDRGEKISDSGSYAEYSCYKPYVMTPNRMLMMGASSSSGQLSNTYSTYYNIAFCSDDRSQMYFPECMEPEEARHCGLPKYIWNGKAVPFMFLRDVLKEETEDYERQYFDDATMATMKEVVDGYDSQLPDEMMPFMAQYFCDEGYKMMKTMRGDMGWCRKDGSMEIPRCVRSYEHVEIMFRLVNSKEMKMTNKAGNVFGGVVQAKEVIGGQNPDELEWEYGCNDGFNDNAAGAICRTQGFQHGAQVPVSKKVQLLKAAGMMALPKSITDDMPSSFGWTNFACDHDDTLATSESCKASRYGDAIADKGVKAMCFSFDRMAVKCFNDGDFGIEVDVSFSKKKIICNAQGSKQGSAIDLGPLNLQVKFLVDDEMVADTSVYKKKKGYIAKYNFRKREFNCVRCIIHTDGVAIAEGKTCKDE